MRNNIPVREQLVGVYPYGKFLLRRVPLPMRLNGAPVDFFVDETDATITVSDNGDPDELIRRVVDAIDKAWELSRNADRADREERKQKRRARRKS